MIITEEAYLEHHGVKGQKWGVRKSKSVSVAKAVGRGSAATGRVAWKGAKLAGRGARGTARFARDNPKAAANIAAGVAAVGLILRARSNAKVNTLRTQQLKEATKILEANKARRMSELGGIATRGKPGGVIRNLAVKEMGVTSAGHKAALGVLSKNLKLKRF